MYVFNIFVTKNLTWQIITNVKLQLSSVTSAKTMRCIYIYFTQSLKKLRFLLLFTKCQLIYIWRYWYKIYKKRKVYKIQHSLVYRVYPKTQVTIVPPIACRVVLRLIALFVRDVITATPDLACILTFCYFY